MILKALEVADEVLAHEVGPRREELAEAHEGRAEVLHHEGQAVWQALLVEALFGARGDDLLSLGEVAAQVQAADDVGEAVANQHGGDFCEAVHLSRAAPQFEDVHAAGPLSRPSAATKEELPALKRRSFPIAQC